MVKKSSRNKTFLVSLIFIVFMSLVVSVFVGKGINYYFDHETRMTKKEYEHQIDWVEKSVDMSNWKTYKDSSNLFTVKYPGNWKVYKDFNYIVPPPSKDCTFDCSPGVFFNVYENKSLLTTKDFLFKLYGEPKEDSNGRYEYYLIDNKPSFFNSYDVTAYDGTLGTGDPRQTIFIGHEDKILQISADSIEQILYTNILSTLHFE